MAPDGKSGKFIVIEGIDGAGSSTQARLLVDWIYDRGRRGVLTAEPTRGPVGALLRQVLTGRVVARKPDNDALPVNNDVIALLFAADRLDHLDCEILPLIASGADVVSDRYYHSSLLYQSLSGDREWIRVLNSHARPPDVTYVLHLPAEQAAERRKQRSREELYETDEVQELLVDSYRDLPALLPGEPIVLVDGRAEALEVHRAVTNDLKRRFGWE